MLTEAHELDENKDEEAWDSLTSNEDNETRYGTGTGNRGAGWLSLKERVALSLMAGLAIIFFFNSYAPKVERSSQLELDNALNLLIADKCSGSEDDLNFARSLLEAHGVRLSQEYQNKYNSDIMNPARNPFYYAASEKIWRRTGSNPEYKNVIIESFMMLKQELLTKSENILVYSHPKRLNADFAKEISSVGTSFAFVYRDNILKREICRLRSCSEIYGYPVYAHNGSKAHVCSHHHSSSGEEIQVHVGTEELLRRIVRERENIVSLMSELKPFINPAHFVTTEDLNAFKYTAKDNVFEKSLESWKFFLKNIIDLDDKITATLMNRYKNKKMHTSVNHTIYNLDEVVQALKSHDPPLDSYLSM